MTHSLMNDETAHHCVATASRTEDGYFGWTDRYGIRPSFFPTERAKRQDGRAHLVANS